MSQQWPPPHGGYPPPQGYGPPPPTQQWGYGPLQPHVVVIQAPPPRAPFNHLLHLVITIFTCGLWLPVWVILAIAH